MTPYNQQFGQIAPYRDLPEDDDQEQQRRNLAAAIAPQRQGRNVPQQAPTAPQAPMQGSGPDMAAPQRAQLQAPQPGIPNTGSLGLPRRPAPADGSLASFSSGGLAAPDVSGRSGVETPGGTRSGSLSDLASRGTGYNPEVEKIRQDNLTQWGGSASATAPQAPAQPARTSDPSWFTGGWDQRKIDAGHDSPKYRVRAALQAAGFDPRQGITPEVEAALDNLGYGDGDVTGSDTYRFNSSDPAFNGMTEFDLIRGYDTGNGQWNFEPVLGAGGGAPSTTMQALGAGQNLQEEQVAQQLGIDTSNPLWRQIFEQLQAEALGGNLADDMYYR